MNALPNILRQPQVVLMSPQDAVEILTQNAFPRQRAIRARWVNELAEILQKGQWATTTITLAQCAEDGKRYLVDGYHRLSAVVKAETPAPLIINLQDCDTFEAVGVLYSRMDRGLPRGVRDSIVARDLPTQTDLPTGTLQAGVAAVNLIRSGFRYDGNLTHKRGHDEKFSELLSWVNELRLYSEAITGSAPPLKRRFHSSPFMSVGLTLFRHQPEKAFAFFRPLATVAEIKSGSGQHVLLTKILLVDEAKKVRESRASDNTVRRVGPAMMCRQIALCWNAFYEDKPIQLLAVKDVNKPIILKGTPYTRWLSEQKE